MLTVNGKYEIYKTAVTYITGPNLPLNQWSLKLDLRSRADINMRKII